MALTLTVNGRAVRVAGPDDARLLDVLREELGLASVREACSVGACGSCTVLLDGQPVSSCLVFAARCEGKSIQTVEGLGEELTPVQQAFLDAGALQCGYCTPGFVLSVTALLDENPAPATEDIKEYLAGNICRCGAYPEILAAVHQAAAALRAQPAAPAP